MDDDDAPSRGSTLSPAINKEKNIYITPRTSSSFPSRGCNRLRFKTFLPRPGNIHRKFKDPVRRGKTVCESYRSPKTTTTQFVIGTKIKKFGLNRLGVVE